MRVATYARVSTKDQSCALQVRDLQTYCAARKFTIFREYVDEGESGAQNSRPELNNLMTDARKRKFRRGRPSCFPQAHNDGEIIGEMNTIYSREGTVIRTNTTHPTGCPVVQNVTVRDTQGNVHTTNVIGGKILP